MNPTVLIADRDAELCDLYQQFLVPRGYDVEIAADGLDCLEKLRRLLPAVLVLDPQLHWGGGDGVLAWLREATFMPRIPVILTATAGYTQDFEAFGAPTILDCLPKPFALSALLERVRLALAKKGHSEPS